MLFLKHSVESIKFFLRLFVINKKILLLYNYHLVIKFKGYSFDFVKRTDVNSFKYTTILYNPISHPPLPSPLYPRFCPFCTCRRLVN